MGSVADACLRRPPPDPFEPRPTGAMAGEFACTATLLVRESGAWNYGEEIPIDVVPNACYELPFGDERLLYWSGIEITLRRDDLKRTREKSPYFLVAALEPVTWGWLACAPLRGENHHATLAERRAKLGQWHATGRPLHELSWDPFLRGKGKYAARLNDPMRLHYDCGRNLGNGFVIGAAPDGIDKAVWRFGLCPAACLKDFELAPAVAPLNRAPGMVRVPRTLPADIAQAAAWYACAGRAEGDGVTFTQARDAAERQLA